MDLLIPEKFLTAKFCCYFLMVMQVISSRVNLFIYWTVCLILCCLCYGNETRAGKEPECCDQHLSPSRISLAKDYFEHGDFLSLENGSIQDSLPFYRAATRLNPLEFRYWERLGNVEILLEYFDLAKERFKRALYLYDACETCKLKLDELLAADTADKLVSPLDVFSISEISVHEPSGERSFDGTLPVVVRQAATYLHLNLSEFTPFHLQAAYGLELTETYPQNMRRKPSRLYTMTLTEAINFVMFPELAFASVDASASGMYIQWNMNNSMFQKLLDKGYNNSHHGTCSPLKEAATNSNSHIECATDTSVESMILNFPTVQQVFNTCMLTDNVIDDFSKRMHWSMMLIGEKDAGMFFHADDLPTNSWQLQTLGSKSWKLCPPVDTLHEAAMKESLLLSGMKFKSRNDFENEELNDTNNFKSSSIYSRSVVNELDLESLQEAMNELYQSIDFFDMDTKNDLAANKDFVGEKAITGDKRVKCVEATVNAGDLIYYPKGWWHQTLNLAHINAALSRSIIGSNNAKAFADAMKSECKHVIVDEDIDTIDNRYLMQSERYKFDSAMCTVMLERCLGHWITFAQ